MAKPAFQSSEPRAGKSPKNVSATSVPGDNEAYYVISRLHWRRTLAGSWTLGQRLFLGPGAGLRRVDLAFHALDWGSREVDSAAAIGLAPLFDEAMDRLGEADRAQTSGSCGGKTAHSPHPPRGDFRRRNHCQHRGGEFGASRAGDPRRLSGQWAVAMRVKAFDFAYNIDHSDGAWHSASRRNLATPPEFGGGLPSGERRRHWARDDAAGE